MGEPLRIESAAQFRRHILALGFTLDRTKGAHEQYICGLGCHMITLDVHPGDLGKPNIRSMIRQSGLSKDDFYSGIVLCRKTVPKPAVDMIK